MGCFRRFQKERLNVCKTTLFAHFLRRKRACAHFWAFFLESAETPHFLPRVMFLRFGLCGPNRDSQISNGETHVSTPMGLPLPQGFRLRGTKLRPWSKQNSDQTQTTPDSVFTKERRNSDHGLSFWERKTQTMVWILVSQGVGVDPVFMNVLKKGAGELLLHEKCRKASWTSKISWLQKLLCVKSQYLDCETNLPLFSQNRFYPILADV